MAVWVMMRGQQNRGMANAMPRLLFQQSIGSVGRSGDSAPGNLRPARPEGLVEPLGRGLLETRRDVAVGVQGDLYAGVPQPLLHHLGVDPPASAISEAWVRLASWSLIGPRLFRRTSLIQAWVTVSARSGLPST